MAWDDWVFGIPTAGGYNVAKWGFNKLTDDPNAENEAKRRALLEQQGALASNFANQGERGFGQLGREMGDVRARLQDYATGAKSISGEALRQGLGQQMAQQRSLAAAGGGPMAARNAAMNMGRASYGMSGQGALAKLQEQMQANQLLGQMGLQQRGQDLQAALGSRQNALTGYGANQQITPEKSTLEKIGPAITAGAALFSDERLKTDVKGADDKARRATEALKAYTYKYKDEKHGKGEQVGIMAQDLERAGLGHAVIETPEGKAVHAGKLAGANAAMISSLAKRVAEIEKGGK